MRIVSLLPSATEIICSLGLADFVAGITHECDYPPEIRTRTVMTRCVFDSDRMTQSEIDDTVQKLATEGKSLYQIDDDLLRAADPDLIVTQDLCHICAITPDEVNRSVSLLNRRPRVISLNPRILDDVFSDLLMVADAAGVDGDAVVHNLQSRVRKIAPASMFRRRPRVACIEWLNPLWRTGHWVPGMVQLAGGEEVLAEIGKPSRPLSWEELCERNPDLLILMPCGYNLNRTREEFSRVRDTYRWNELKAFQNQSIYAVDANSYFSRSGPRLVDGLELLAEILHPEYFSNIAPVHSYIRIS